MKHRYLVLILTCLSGCSTVTSDPWGWLDDPEQQRWVNVAIVAEHWLVSLQVPENGTAGIEQMVSVPPLDRGAESITINVPKGSTVNHERMAYFQWDGWWGGWLKESGYDFRLDIWVYRTGDHEDLLELDIDERIQRRVDEWTNEYSDPMMQDGSIRENFFEGFQISSHRSAHGLWWVVENSPSTKGDSVSYRTPISENLMLEVGFFVNEKRYDWKEDSEWNQRRWGLCRQILDTVQITEAR